MTTTITATSHDVLALALRALTLRAHETVCSTGDDPGLDWAGLIDAANVAGWAGGLPREPVALDRLPTEVLRPLRRVALYVESEAADDLRFMDDEEARGVLCPEDDDRPRRRADRDLARRVLEGLEAGR